MNARKTVTVRMATAEDREGIYALRHAVYAEELHQHAPNQAQRLLDSLDDSNVYLVACVGDELAGFISITPPGAPQFSVEKYIPRNELPFARDRRLFEARLLTVAPPHRGTLVATALMYATLRHVEVQGGDRIIGIGRREVLPVYRKVGFELLGREVESGAVRFELMVATTERIRGQVSPMWLARAERELDWQLPFSFRPPAPCFHGGAFFEAIGVGFDALWKRHDVINADVLDAWFPPSPRVTAALHEQLSWLTRTSPPAGCEGMLRTIAGTRGLDDASLLPGGGSSDLIFLALRQWLSKSSRVLLLDPTYGEYAHVLNKVIGCHVERLTLAREQNYDLDPVALAEALQRRFDLIVLVNPNSPTGRHCPADRLGEVLRAAPAETRVWSDETYVEYIGADASLEQLAGASHNVFVCKSMSKVYALSGLRAAYLCGPRRSIAELRAITPPWAVSLPAQVAAVNALRDPAYYAARYGETHVLRGELARELEAFGWEVTPGCANFLLCHLPDHQGRAAAVVQRCRERNLFLRDVSNMGVQANALRIAVKDAETNRRMLQILRDVLEQPPYAEREDISDTSRITGPAPSR